MRIYFLNCSACTELIKAIPSARYVSSSAWDVTLASKTKPLPYPFVPLKAGHVSVSDTKAFDALEPMDHNNQRCMIRGYADCGNRMTRRAGGHDWVGWKWTCEGMLLTTVIIRIQVVDKANPHLTH